MSISFIFSFYAHFRCSPCPAFLFGHSTQQGQGQDSWNQPETDWPGKIPENQPECSHCLIYDLPFNGFRLHPLQRIVRMESTSSPAFLPSWKQQRVVSISSREADLDERHARQIPWQKVRVPSLFLRGENVGWTLRSQMRCELIQQIVPRYREASASQKGVANGDCPGLIERSLCAFGIACLILCERTTSQHNIEWSKPVFID